MVLVGAALLAVVSTFVVASMSVPDACGYAP